MQLSLRTFTDNVIVLAIENCLVQDIPSIFTMEDVSRMGNTKLQKLAAESPEIQHERAEVLGQYQALKLGLQSCNKYRERRAVCEYD
jgi:hypothetical protein